MKGLTATYIVN